MSIVITEPLSPTPSDNPIIFKIISNTGVPQDVTPDGNNFLGLKIVNVSGDFSTGVWDVVVPLEGDVIDFIKLPNIGTELISDLYTAAGLPVPNLPDNLDRYTPNGLQLEFSGGTSAQLTGEFISVDDPTYIWVVDITFENKANWATWSGAGNTYAEVIQDFPKNRIVFNDGMAAVIDEETIESFVGTALLGYTNDGTTITFSNNNWTVSPIGAAESAALLPNVKEMYLRCSSVPAARTFSGWTALEKIHFLNKGFNDYSGTVLFSDNPALEEVLFLGWEGAFTDSLFNNAGDLSSLTRLFLPNADGIPPSATGWLDGITFSTLNLWINVETLNLSQQEVEAVDTAGGTVVYNDSKINPDGFAITTQNEDWQYWEIDSTASTLDGKAGSPLEGISLTVDNPQDDRPGLQHSDTGTGGGSFIAAMTSKETVGIGMNFTITGVTTGSIFFGANSYSFEIDVYINNELYNTHRVFASPGEQVEFDVQSITRNIVGAPQLPTVGVGSAFNYGTVRIVVSEKIGGVTIDADAQSKDVVFFKGRLNATDFFNWDPDEWLPSNVNQDQGLFLTNYPRTEPRMYKRGTPFYLSFFYPGSPPTITNILKVRRILRNAAGTIIDTEIITATYIFFDNLPNVWKVGTINVSGTFWTIPGDNAATAEFTLYNDVDDEPIGETLTITFFSDCDYGAPVYFMNQYGQMEPFYFTRLKTDTAKVQGFGGEFNDGTYNTSNNGDADYLRRATDEVTLRTGWLTESVQNWLEKEIVESPYILILIDGGLFRAKIKTNKWKRKTYANDMLFDVEVKFEMSEIRYSPLV